MQNPTTLPADTPVTAFATGVAKDDPMRNFGFTVAAYSVLWLVLLGFVFLGWRRQSALDARIAELEGALARKGPGQGG
ncbi:MAG: hypothetical protein MUF64_17470 [Polyangiaceae bacterium]|jgi:hypothetical protein|nr:hypothetical protein [Polyangiaceae bacterium]